MPEARPAGCRARGTAICGRRKVSPRQVSERTGDVERELGGCSAARLGDGGCQCATRLRPGETRRRGGSRPPATHLEPSHRAGRPASRDEPQPAARPLQPPVQIIDVEPGLAECRHFGPRARERGAVRD
jgi:hypothetical protein